MKASCDSCKYFKEDVEGLPCTNKKMESKFSRYNFWEFYQWAKSKKLFNCKGFQKKTEAPKQSTSV